MMFDEVLERPLTLEGQSDSLSHLVNTQHLGLATDDPELENAQALLNILKE